LKKPKPCHCEECRVLWGGEHDEAISIYDLAMRARRLLRRHRSSTLPLTMTPRNDSSEVFQRPAWWDTSMFSVYFGEETGLGYSENERDAAGIHQEYGAMG
jgi:hypothetical protein